MRILKNLLLIIIAFLLALIALIPTFLSINATRNLILNCIAYTTEYTISIGSANMGWVTPIEASDIKIIDKKGNERFSCKKFKSDRTLFQLIVNRNELGQAVVTSPKVVLVPEATAPSNTTPNAQPDHVKKSPKTKKIVTKPAPEVKIEKTSFVLPTADITVENGDIEVLQLSEKAPYSLKNLNFNCKISPEHAQIQFDVDAQDSHISINCTAEQPAGLHDLLGTITKPNNTSSRLNWDIDVRSINWQKLQTLGIPELEFAQTVFGGPLSISTKGMIAFDDLSCVTNITSANINSNFTVKKSGQNLIFDGSKLLLATLTLDSYALLSAYYDLPPQIVLTQNGQIELSLSPTTIPIPVTLTPPQDFSFTLRSVGPIPFTLTDSNTSLVLNHLTTGSNKGQTFTFSSNTGLQLGSKTAKATLLANGTNDSMNASCDVSGSWSDILMPIRKDLAELLGPNFLLAASASGPYAQLSGTGKVITNPADADFNFSMNPRQLQCRITRAAGVEPNYLPLTAEIDVLSDNSGNLLVNSPLVALSAKNVLVDTAKSTFQLTNTATLDLKVPKSEKTNPFAINFSLNPTTLNWEQKTGSVSFDLSSTEISGEKLPVTLLKGHGALDLKQKTADLEFQVHQQDKALNILDVTFNAQQTREKPTYTAKIQLNNFPCHFLPKETVALIGNTISGNIENSLSDTGHLKGTLQSSSIAVDFDLSTRHEDEIHLINGSKNNALDITYTLQPEQATIAFPGLTLQSPLTATVALKKINVPVNHKLKIPHLIDETTCALDISLSNAKGVFNNHAVNIAPIECVLNLVKGSRSVQFKVQSQGNSGTHINVEGKAQNLWNQEAFTPKEATIEAQGNIDEIPIGLIEATRPLGKSMKVAFQGKLAPGLNGFAKLNARADSFHANADLLFQKAVLTLNAPLELFFSITPEMGSTLLKNANPLLASAVRSKSDIKLRIEKNDLSVPLSPFSVNTIACKKAELDLGKIRVKGGGILQTILTLLRAKIGSEGEFDLWCTPVYIDMNQGIINCKRADFLVGDNVQLATWGTINLKDDKINLVVGVPEKTLRTTLFVYDLPKSFMLQLPITGPVSNPDLDKTRATAKIAGLGVQGKGLNPAVSIIGGLLYAAATVTESEGPVPPPTTHPFPWESQRAR